MSLFRHKKRSAPGGIVPAAPSAIIRQAFGWESPTRVICTHAAGALLFDVYTHDGSRRSAELCAGLHAALLLHAAAHEEG
jgi:hypothetical protein